MTLHGKHLLFLPILILIIMHIKTTVVGSIESLELDFKYCFSLSLYLSQHRFLQQIMLFGLAFFHCGDEDFNRKLNAVSSRHKLF